MRIRWVDRSKIPTSNCFMCDSQDGRFSIKHFEFTKLQQRTILGSSQYVCNACFVEYQQLVHDRNHAQNEKDQQYLHKILGSV